jgi:putative endonuclease
VEKPHDHAESRIAERRRANVAAPYRAARHTCAEHAYVGAVTLARQRLGRSSERLVADRLAAQGFSIVARNARIHTTEAIGEIDLIALDGDTLVFVEVKAARAATSHGPERPALAVDRRKQLRLRRLARAWLSERELLPRFRSLRFDVVGLRLDGASGTVAWEHLRGAF